MAKGNETGERTEKATPRKLRKARREGQVGNTPELGAWAGMLAATFVLPGVFRSLMNSTSASLIQAVSIIRKPDTGNALQLGKTAASSIMHALLPLSTLVAVIGIAGVGLQGGIWFSGKALLPKFAKINPLAGWKRMFGPQGGWQLLKALGKSTAVGAVVYLSVKNFIPRVYGAGSMSLADLVTTGVDTALNVLRLAAVAGLTLAIADIAVVRRRNQKHLKMSKYELKQEFKHNEGDPLQKSVRRAQHLRLSRQRMMAEVPKADVVVVNPTHVAVALSYEAGKGAPRVVAKGADNVAARIRALASEHRIPLVEDVPLARTLFAVCEIGAEIPAELYRAVAAVLAFIFTLRARGSAAGMHHTRTRSLLPDDAPGLRELAVDEPIPRRVRRRAPSLASSSASTSR